MGRRIIRFVGRCIGDLIIAISVMLVIVLVTALVETPFFYGAMLLDKQRHRDQEPPAPAVSIAEPEKKVVPPPVEKQPVAEKRAAKKVAKKKPSVSLPAMTHEPVREAREWKRWNAAPYANSQEEACRKAPEAIDGFALPATVKELFKKLLGATCKGGAEAWLTPHMPLEQMWSGPDAGHAKAYLMNNVPVGELPVLKSPEGRPYPKGAVAETAKALAWRIEHEGRAYLLYLPLACWNWSWKFGVPPAPRPTPAVVPPPPVQEECVTVEYVVAPGDEVRFAVLAQRRLPASACWQLCDGADCAAPPSPCDDPNCWREVQDTLPAGFEPQHTGKYVARSAKQSLRLPREARMNFIALCVTREWFGQSNSWIVQPSAWNAFGKKTKLHVPYGGYAWPVWGEETIWPGWEYQPGY